MAGQLGRKLVILLMLLAFMQLSQCQDEPSEESEEDDSSSEETVEDSNENEQRRRRSIDSLGLAIPQSEEVDAKNSRAIPGLPDPSTILKIAEILTSVGQQILPLLVQGNAASLIDPERMNREKRNFKRLVDEIGMRINFNKLH